MKKKNEGDHSPPHEFYCLFSVLRSLVISRKQSSHRQADPLLVEIYLCDLAINYLTYRKDICNIVYSLVSDLRDMDKTVDTVNDLCKSTKACDRNNSSLNYLTYLIVSLEDLPWFSEAFLYVNETFFVSLSISLIVTVILSPTETTSEGCLILFQERSILLIRPSTPPRSTNTP